MLALLASKIMKELSEEIPSGYFLAKIEIKGDDILNKDFKDFNNVSAEIVKMKSSKDFSYILCQGEVTTLAKKKVKVIFSLMKGSLRNKIDNNSDLLDDHLCKFDHSFILTSTQIEEFCILIGDSNDIHKGKNPVVPGIFIIKKIEEWLEELNIIIKKNFRVSFYNPIYADSKVFLINNINEKNEIEGISNGKSCFKLKFFEEAHNE